MDMGNLVEGQTTDIEEGVKTAETPSVTMYESCTGSTSIATTSVVSESLTSTQTVDVKPMATTDVSSDYIDMMELYDFSIDSEEERPKTTTILKKDVVKSAKKYPDLDDECIKGIKSTSKKSVEKEKKVESTMKKHQIKKKDDDTAEKKKSKELTFGLLLKQRYNIDMELKKMSGPDVLMPVTMTVNNISHTFNLGTKCIRKIFMKIRDSGLVDEHIFPNLDDYMKKTNEEITKQKAQADMFEKEFVKNKCLFDKFIEWKKQNDLNVGDSSYYSCLICNNFYNGDDHMPYALHCGHIVCDHCKKKANKCPMCNTRISTLKEPIKLFPLVSPNIMFLDDVKKTVASYEQMRDSIVAQIEAKKNELENITQLVNVAKLSIKHIKTAEIIEHYTNKLYVVKNTLTSNVMMFELKNVLSCAFAVNGTNVTCTLTHRSTPCKFNISKTETKLPEFLLVMYNDAELKKWFPSYDPTSRKKEDRYVPCVTDMIENCSIKNPQSSDYDDSTEED